VPPNEHLTHLLKRQIKLKICIVSDSHDRSEPLAAAVAAAHAAGAKAVIHCGDVIGAHTLRASLKLGLPIHVVHGNNLGDPMAIQNLMAKSNGHLVYHGMDATLELGRRRILSPTIRIMATAWLAPEITILSAAVTAISPR